MSEAAEIRLANNDDLPAINEIYNYYVLNSTSTYQTSPSDAAERMGWYLHHGPDYPVTVASIGGRVVAWGSISKFHVREAYQYTVESSIYVHHEHHRRGLGRLLMQDMVARARQLGYHTMLAGISADQAASLSLHESLGFKKVAHLHEVGKKFDRWLDVVWMQLML